MPFTVTAALVLLVRVNVVNGTRDVPPGAKEFAGCAPAATVMPGPVGTTTVVPPVVVPPVVVPVAVLTDARVNGPKYPTAGEILFAA